MGVNIKNAETHRLIQELARATGESQTTAVTVAVQERLERIQQDGTEERQRLADRLLAIGKDVAERLPEDAKALDHDALLYDEHGLPR